MRFFYFFSLLFFITSSFKLSAQTEIGPLSAYNTQSATLGAGLAGAFRLSPRWTLAPDLVYFKPRTSGSVNFKRMDLNVNAHVQLLKIGKTKFYGLTGYRIHLHRRSYTDDIPTENTNELNSAVNLGIGSFLSFDHIRPFAEVQYSALWKEPFSEREFTLKAGIKFSLNSAH